MLATFVSRLYKSKAVLEFLLRQSLSPLLLSLAYRWIDAERGIRSLLDLIFTCHGFYVLRVYRIKEKQSLFSFNPFSFHIRLPKMKMKGHEPCKLVLVSNLHFKRPCTIFYCHQLFEAMIIKIHFPFSTSCGDFALRVIFGLVWFGLSVTNQATV